MAQILEEHNSPRIYIDKVEISDKNLAFLSENIQFFKKIGKLEIDFVENFKLASFFIKIAN